ncbi:MAG: dependent oxidoreductase [Gemmatimonadetes bacterium]|nr:dependent oxidoreductase [Gemmatimonadota bacterium]
MYDVAVVGLGAMGSAALYHLAARGARVVGIDTNTPPHTLGSTHGRTRIIREAYAEHPSYVPLVRRAYANWSALEAASGITLFRRTGGLMLGPPGGALVSGAAESARERSIDVELLDADGVMSRFPALHVDAGMVGLVEKSAGILFPERCIEAHLALARGLGAEVQCQTQVMALAHGADGVRLMTTNGAISARKIVMATGPWTSELLAMLDVSMALEVERQTVHWFDASGNGDVLTAGKLPILMIEHEPNRVYYAIPDVGDGLKAGIHHEGATVTPVSVNREVTATDVEPVERLTRRFLPSAAATPRESAVCLYTNTLDENFVIDTLTDAPNVVLLSACSGHGFKFASAIGEIAAQLTLDESPALDISHFSAGRFN